MGVRQRLQQPVQCHMTSQAKTKATSVQHEIHFLFNTIDRHDHSTSHFIRARGLCCEVLVLIAHHEHQLQHLAELHLNP